MNPRNVSVADYKLFLIAHGCKEIRHHKGHYIFSRSDFTRPIIFQDHIDPVPLFIIKNGLKTLMLTLSDIRNFQAD